nr:hypothetical protein [Tanacetum cinerariifolium]
MHELCSASHKVKKHIKSLWKLSSYLLAILQSRLLLKSQKYTCINFGLPIKMIRNSDAYNFKLDKKKCLDTKAQGITRSNLVGLYNQNNIDYVALLWEDFMYQVDNKEISSTRKEHMPYPRFSKVIISHFISKDKTISMRNMINLHTIRDDSLFDIKDSKDYKTYYDFATGKVSLKKARKFKKIASPLRKWSPVKEAEPVKKAKRVKSHAKKSTAAPTVGVVIKDNPKVPDESKAKPSETSEETGVKPGVPDVLKGKSSDSDNELWGNSKDKSDDDNDDDNANDDDIRNEDDDGNDAHDSERTDLDNDDENPSFTLKYYDKEKHDKEYESDDDNENVYEEEDDDLYKDMDVRSLGEENEKEMKGHEEMTDTDHNKTESLKQSSFSSSDFASKFLILDNVPPMVDEVSSMMNIKNHQEKSTTQAPSLFTVPETAILKISTAYTTTAPPTILMITPLPHLTTPPPAPITVSTATLIPILLDFSSLFRFDQRVSTMEIKRIRYDTRTALQSYTKEFEKKSQEERKLYIDVVEKLVKDIIKDEVKNQLPQILPKEVSDFTTPAAASLTEFELKKILLDKIEKSKSYQAAPEHKELYDGLTVKKVQDTGSYEFLLANKKGTVNAEVFRTYLDICLRVEIEKFTNVPDDETALTFLIDLGYKGPLNRHTNMFIDHMHQPWITLAAISNKKEKRSRRENMPYLRITKIIINHFLKQHKSLTNLNHKHYHTIKDDGIVRKLKFVRIGEVYQEYRLFIPDVMLTDVIKQSKSFQMFIKSSINQIPPKKSRGKGLKGKKTAEESQETVDVSEESQPKPEPAKKKNASRRVVKKKVTFSAGDNIISDDPNTALELAKSISQTNAEEAEEARNVHATHARIVIEFVSESAKKKSSGRSSKSVVNQDTLSAPKSKPATSKAKLKGAPSLTLAKQEAANIMQALKESLLMWGDEQDSEHSDDAEKDEKHDDTDDEGYDHVSDKQDDDDDEDDKTESDEDDIYKYKICVRKDEDEEMKDAEFEGSNKGDEEITDAAKEETKKTSEAKDDTKKTKLPSSSSSLSVSSYFGDQFLKLTSDSSLVSSVKDRADADKIPISVILETTNLPPIPEIVTETPVSTIDPSPQVTPIISIVQQTTTAIPTPTITNDAPTIITTVLESNALTYVELRHLLELTKKPTPTAEQESKKSPSEILKIKKKQTESQKNPQFTIKSTDMAALEECDLKSTLYKSMHANKSFNKNPTNNQLYHALMEALIKDENAMDKGVADTFKDHKKKHDDDEDPPAGPNQGKKTKRRRTKESESLKKPSYTKETAKGKALTKGSKTGKSASAKEPIEEPIVEVIMDDVGDDLVRDDDQPQAASKPKTSKTLNPEWFKQPSRPPTPDPEWNKHQVVLDQPTQPCIELEYNFQECLNVLTDKLDWNNLEGDRYLFNLSKPLPLQGPLEVAYTTSITKTKAARYKIKGIEDMVSKIFKQNVYSTKAILGVKSVSVKKLHGYGHLNDIVMKRSDQQLYKFKEGDFVDLNLNDIKEMLLLAVQHKLFHLDGSDIVYFIVALCDLGSFEEETDKSTDLHQHLLRISTQQLETMSQITRDVVTIHTKMASQDLKTDSECMAQPSRFDVFFCDQHLVFQQHQDESLYDSWTRFKDIIQKVLNHGLSIWTLIEIFLKHLDSLSHHIIKLKAEGDLRKFNYIGSWEVPSFDKPEPQPQPLPNCPPLDASLGTERGLKPPIKLKSPNSFRMNNLTIHTPPSSLVASFHLRDLYFYYRPCIDDPKKHYGFKPGLLGHSGSLGVDFLKFEMIDDDWGLESKEVYFIGRGLSLRIWPKEVEKMKLGSS